MITVLLSNWSFQELLDFQKLQSKGSVEKAMVLASKVITDWDYDVPLGDEEALLDLTPTQSAKVMRAVIDKMDEFSESISVSEVAVDFDVWTTRRFLEFNDAQTTQNFTKVEAMIHEIASIEGVSPDEPLSAVNGMKLLFAISSLYRKVANGKN